MESAESSSRRAPAVGRGHKMRAAVLEAAITELTESGYTALTVERVAQRAGVHKTTIYRNWKDADGLVTEALAGHFATDIPIPDTGAVESDLRALARSLVATMTTPTGRALLTTVLSDAVRLPGSPKSSTRSSTTGSGGRNPLSPGPSSAANYLRTPTRPNSSRPSSRRSTSGSCSPGSRSTKRPQTGQCTLHWPPRTHACCRPCDRGLRAWAHGVARLSLGVGFREAGVRQRRTMTRAVSSVAPTAGSRSRSSASASGSGSVPRWWTRASARRARPVSMSSRRRSISPSL